MQINLAAAAMGSRIRSAMSHMSWRRLLLIAVFVVTLAFTVSVGGLVVGLVRPAAADDPEALRTMLTEISGVSSAVDTDLSTLGFVAEGDGAALATAGPVTATIAAQAPLSLTTSPLTATATSTATPVLPVWDRKGRVNILLMGLLRPGSPAARRRSPANGQS